MRCLISNVQISELISKFLRLMVLTFWLDFSQKIKTLGYNGVPSDTDWALFEDQESHFTAESAFALELSFRAASEASIYLLARPGPYINAEVSGGGYPGWIQIIRPILRIPTYINPTANYVQIIA